MMAGKNRCQYCGTMFVPDRRVGLRQKTCSVTCRKARKLDSNERFRRDNPDYWRGRYSVVKEWRSDHPDYQKTWRRNRKEWLKELKPLEIQAEMFSKALDVVQKSICLLREIQARMPISYMNIQRKTPVYFNRPS
jgi:hypothetical protein